MSTRGEDERRTDHAEDVLRTPHREGLVVRGVDGAQWYSHAEVGLAIECTEPGRCGAQYETLGPRLRTGLDGVEQGAG